MKRVAVKSSHILSVGHDGAALEVEFKGNKVYRYPDVPREVFDDIIAAPSVGQALAQKVIGKYAHVRVGGDDGSTR